MPEGPLGINRPLVKTHLKYTVKTFIPENIWFSPPLAREVLDIRVNIPQADVVEVTKRNIGKVIEAANGLAHPSSHIIVHEEVEKPQTGGVIPPDHVGINWTYVMQGVGIAEAADTSTTSSNVVKIHQVLIENNDEPIERAQKIREFDSGPIDINRVEIHTE